MRLTMLELSKSTLAFGGEITLVDLKELGGSSTLAFRDADIALKGDGKLMELAAGILKGIHNFKAKVDLAGSLQQPTVSVATDLDAKIAKGLGESFSKEASAYTQQLKSKLDAQLGDKLNALKDSAGGLADINGMLDDRSNALTEISKSAGSLGKESGGTQIKKRFSF